MKFKIKWSPKRSIQKTVAKFIDVFGLDDLFLPQTKCFKEELTSASSLRPAGQASFPLRARLSRSCDQTARNFFQGAAFLARRWKWTARLQSVAFDISWEGHPNTAQRLAETANEVCVSRHAGVGL